MTTEGHLAGVRHRLGDHRSGGGAGVGQNLPRLLLELGGHAPFVVLDDADVGEAAVAAARRSFSNMGQICIAVNRVDRRRAGRRPVRRGVGGRRRRRPPRPDGGRRDGVRLDDHRRRQAAGRRPHRRRRGRGATLIVGGGDPVGCARRPTSNRPCSTGSRRGRADERGDVRTGRRHPPGRLRRGGADGGQLAALRLGGLRVLAAASSAAGASPTASSSAWSASTSTTPPTCRRRSAAGSCRGSAPSWGREGLLAYTRPRTIRMRI